MTTYKIGDKVKIQSSCGIVEGIVTSESDWRDDRRFKAEVLDYNGIKTEFAFSKKTGKVFNNHWEKGMKIIS